MKKIIIILSIVFLLSIISSTNSFAYFRDQYWECTRIGEESQGDPFGRFGGSHDPNGICTKTCCLLYLGEWALKLRIQ